MVQQNHQTDLHQGFTSDAWIVISGTVAFVKIFDQVRRGELCMHHTAFPI